MFDAFVGGSGGVDCASVVFAVATSSAVFFEGEAMFAVVVELVFGIRIGGFLAPVPLIEPLADELECRAHKRDGF